jgi:hypothetical protein
MKMLEVYLILADICLYEKQMIDCYETEDDDGDTGHRFENGDKWIFISDEHLEGLKRDQFCILMEHLKADAPAAPEQRIDFQGAKEAIGDALAAL